MFRFFRKNSFLLSSVRAVSDTLHPMLTISFMRQDVFLPLKKGKSLIQRLTDKQTYEREIGFLPNERTIDYGTN